MAPLHTVTAPQRTGMLAHHKALMQTYWSGGAQKYIGYLNIMHVNKLYNISHHASAVLSPLIENQLSSKLGLGP